MFTYLMNVVVISRLVYLRDGMVGRTTIAVVVVVQTLAVAVLEPSIAVLAYAVLMAGANLLFYRLEQRSSATNGLRVLLLGLQALLTAALSSSAANARFQPWLRATPGFLALYTWPALFSQPVDLGNAGVVLLGFLLVANEANLLIRYVLERFGLVATPMPADPPYLISLDRPAYSAGRYIGILERLLIYILVLNAQFATIGLVLAAKSFARFRQLEERQFAEYVLIGTLLSVLVAILVSLVVRALVS